MKCQHLYKPQSGKFIHQLTDGITCVNNIHLGFLRDYWKGITKEYNREMVLSHAFGYNVP